MSQGGERPGGRMSQGGERPRALCTEMELWGHFRDSRVQIENLNQTYLELFPESGQFRFCYNISCLLPKSWRNLTKRPEVF